MAAPTFVAASTFSARAFVAAVDRPAGVVSGHVMVAVLAIEAADGTIGVPSGWATAGTENSGTLFRQSVYYKVAGASEPSSYSFSNSLIGGLAVVIAAYSGADQSSPVDVIAGQVAISTTITAPSVTTTKDDSRVIVATGGRDGSTTISLPSGTNNRAVLHGATSNFCALRVAEFTQATAGATAVKTATAGASTRNVGQQIAIKSGNLAPNAPTLTAPIGGTVLDAADPVDLEGTFSDPDAGDTLSQVRVQHRLVGGAWTTVTEAASGTTFAVTLAGGRTPGSKEWRARTWDAAGVLGPWTGIGQWTDGAQPDDPVLVAPAAAEVITDDPSLTEWTAPNQDAFQVQVWSATGGGGTLHHDSGTVVSTAREYSTPRPVTGRTEWTRVRVRFTSLWSGWVERSNAVTYTPPEIPFATVTEADGHLLVSIVNPFGDTTTESNELRRQQQHPVTEEWHDTQNSRIGALGAYNTIGRGIAADGSHPDWEVASRGAYRYQAVAVGTNGTKAEGAWVEVPAGGPEPPPEGGGLAPSTTLAPSTSLAPSAG